MTGRSRWAGVGNRALCHDSRLAPADVTARYDGGRVDGQGARAGAPLVHRPVQRAAPARGEVIGIFCARPARWR